MLRFLAVPATCLVLCVTAAAQDLHAQDLAALAIPSPPDRPQPVPARGPERVASADGRRDPGGAAAAIPSDPSSPEDGRADLGSLALRGAGRSPSRTLADLKTPAEASKPWCAQERRVGTGTGFCLIN